MSKPALILPIGEKDWQWEISCPRLDFLALIKPKLDALGWTCGVDFKSDRIFVDKWHGYCAKYILKMGGRISWHPANFKLAYGIGRTGQLTDLLRQAGEDARTFSEEFPLEALVIHPDALQYGEPRPEAGMERYNARVTASQVLRAIRNQARPLKELNEICGGILHIENVHNCLFSEETADSLPTYEAMQLGYLEIPWVAEQAGIKTVIDAEHFFGAYNFYHRQKEFEGLYHTHKWHWTRAQHELSELAGYLVKKGYPAIGTRDVSFSDCLLLFKPNIFHIGGAQQLVDQEGQVAAHCETDINNPAQKQTLLLELDYIMKNNCLGAVVEVEGMGGKPSYSLRSVDDNVAKYRECLTIVDAVEKLQTGVWQVDSVA